VITKSKQETINLGKKIAASFKGGDIVLLEGNLGAGKTTLTKGIARYFGVKKNITSPTFSLMNVYEVKGQKSALKGIRPLADVKSKNPKIQNLVHVDTYRLENENDLIEIGIEDYLGALDTICLVEWPEKIKKLLKNKKVTSIKITHEKDNERKIMIE